jgi:DNA-binding NarL/FixJ family response regulator
MRVILVGPAEERRRLRTRVPSGLEIAGEAATIAAARALPVALDGEADAILSPASPSIRDDELDEPASDPLTPRELDVLGLMAEGLSNKSIAGRLGISDQTVKFHVASIGGKLNALNRTDAVRRGVRRGLITL